jgi:hypothetical protein
MEFVDDPADLRGKVLCCGFKGYFWFLDSPWRLSSMSRMVSAMVVELHPVGYQLGDFSHGLIAPKPQFLVFDASPEALDKQVVHPAALPVHADFNTVSFDRFYPFRTREL